MKAKALTHILQAKYFFLSTLKHFHIELRKTYQNVDWVFTLSFHRAPEFDWKPKPQKGFRKLSMEVDFDCSRIVKAGELVIQWQGKIFYCDEYLMTLSW